MIIRDTETPPTVVLGKSLISNCVPPGRLGASRNPGRASRPGVENSVEGNLSRADRCSPRPERGTDTPLGEANYLKI